MFNKNEVTEKHDSTLYKGGNDSLEKLIRDNVHGRKLNRKMLEVFRKKKRNPNITETN